MVRPRCRPDGESADGRQRGLGLAGEPPVDPSGLRCVAGLAGSVAGLVALGLAGWLAAPVVPLGDGLVFDPPAEPSGLRSAPPALSSVFCDSDVCALATAIPVRSAAVASMLVMVFMGRKPLSRFSVLSHDLLSARPKVGSLGCTKLSAVPRRSFTAALSLHRTSSR